jgi:hypothetical protein
MRLAFTRPIGDHTVVVEPLPEDRAEWRTRVAGVVTSEEATHTPSGWPLTIVQRDGRLWAFYELFDRGVVVATAATDGAREALLAADLDRSPREVAALSQLWGID